MSRQANPLQVPQLGPYGETYPLTGHFYISLEISHCIFPPEPPVREPPPCSLTGSPWAGIFCHQSHWPIYPFIHSFMYICRSPQKGALLHTGKNVRSPSTWERSTSQGMCKQFPGDPWIHFCNGCFANFYCCTVHSEFRTGHSPTDALFIKLGKF
jgi:hypothetical protein